MRLMATEAASGCWKLTTPSREMLKLCQFRIAELVSWLTLSVLPAATAVARPEVTKLEMLPHEPATQGTGRSAAGAAPEPRISRLTLSDNDSFGNCVTTVGLVISNLESVLQAEVQARIALDDLLRRLERVGPVERPLQTAEC